MIRSSYTRSLEAEVSRLRRRELELLNVILQSQGLREIPTAPADPEAAPVAALLPRMHFLSRRRAPKVNG